jgi:hypothetical protein
VGQTEGVRATAGILQAAYLYGADYQFAIGTSTAADGAQSLRISSPATDTSQFGYAVESHRMKNCRM